MKIQRDKRLHAVHTTTIKSRYQEIKKIVTAYQHTHHPSKFFITPFDICESPGVSESIVDPSDEPFQECLARIPDLIPATHALALENRRGEMLKLLPEGTKDEDLPLAISWFRCRDCGRSFHYAEVVKHTCFGLHMWGYGMYEEIKTMEPLEQVDQLCGPGRWTTDRLIYWKEAAELTKQIIEAAEMDPKKVTSDELDGAKHRFAVCTGGGSSTVTIVGWRCLVSYAIVTIVIGLSWPATERGYVQVTGRYDKPSAKRPPPDWRIMKAVEMPEFSHPNVRLEKNEWGCLHCWTSNAVYTRVTWVLIKLHLKEKCVINIASTFVSTPSSKLLGCVDMTSKIQQRTTIIVRSPLFKVITLSKNLLRCSWSATLSSSTFPLVRRAFFYPTVCIFGIKHKLHQGPIPY